eukprot:CAMPEP_0196999222 /NCGR_PEP_ID=MMETSP1380-20130617/4444_1 /TAXON_ID=5936 /ORGANISM="Euplotes crassus, Strain CT5" /LENGTH=246 /DNA_ID=CAMNT_0042416061 /DNA_START=1 /DNA_END=742 /DNA_ORIENTATION=+
MESKKGIWLRTKDDGVLLFKNINLSQQESDKEEKKDPDAVEHSKETVIHEFEEDVQPFTHGSKYFHTEMQVFCTVTDRTEGEDGKLTSIKINMPTLQMEGVPVDIDENSEKILQSSMDIYLRGVQKSGSKFTVQGTYNLNRSLKENMALVFQSLGQNMGNFKLFHNQKILSLSEDFSEIYESGKDTYIYALNVLASRECSEDSQDDTRVELGHVEEVQMPLLSLQTKILLLLDFNFFALKKIHSEK